MLLDQSDGTRGEELCRIRALRLAVHRLAVPKIKAAAGYVRGVVFSATPEAIECIKAALQRSVLVRVETHYATRGGGCRQE